MKNVTEQSTFTNTPKRYNSFQLSQSKSSKDLDEKNTQGSISITTPKQKEYNVASMMSKLLRQSLSERMMEICASYTSGKLTAQFLTVPRKEDGKLGTRPMRLSKHGHVLNGFEFNPEAPYNKIFDAKYFVKRGSRKGQVILHFPSFIPEKAFKKPDNATNFKIDARLVALSDYSFNPKEGVYCATNEDVHGLVGSYESQMLPLLRIPIEPMTSQVSIPTSKLNSEDVGIFLVMAVSFYRYTNGSFLHLPKQSAMQIQEVY